MVSLDLFKAISSLASCEGSLYWTSFTSVGSTMYYADLFGGRTDGLLQGETGTLIDSNDPYGVTATGGSLLYGDHRDIWTTALLSGPASGPANPLSILPVDEILAGVVATEEWLIVTGRSNVGIELSVAPRSGAGLVQIAKGLQTPAILGPAGITFVDASGALVYIRLDDLGYIAFGHPAPT